MIAVNFENNLFMFAKGLYNIKVISLIFLHVYMYKQS